MGKQQALIRRLKDISIADVLTVGAAAGPISPSANGAFSLPSTALHSR